MRSMYYNKPGVESTKRNLISCMITVHSFHASLLDNICCYLLFRDHFGLFMRP